MYTLLLVDDEEFEREGMARLVPWEEHEIQLIGAAKNGEEGFEMACREKPDLILTDIKMPLLDGIGMIRKLQEAKCESEIVVLSGYGEYEFTSQAMELGVRHYILKPVDEEKIIETMEKAILELKQRRHQSQALNQAVQLRPIAMQQILRDALLDRGESPEELERAAGEFGMLRAQLMLLAFRRSGRNFDPTEAAALENILKEVLGADGVYTVTFTEDDAIFFIHALPHADRFPANRVLNSIDPDQTKGITAALSRAGSVQELPALYQEICLLFHMRKIEKGMRFLHYDLFGGEVSPDMIFDYSAIYRADNYPAILFELYLASLKMSYAGYDERIQRDLFQWICALFSPRDARSAEGTEANAENFGFADAADSIALQKNCAWSEQKEEKQKREILIAFYTHLADTDLSIRMLACDCLFMNEDYFGRLFRKLTGEKFNSYLQHTRILLAQRLMQYQPEMLIQDLARLTGYAEDGQYFSKAFRKETGSSPSEYRKSLI